MRGWIPWILVGLLVVVVGFAVSYNWRAQQAVEGKRLLVGPTQQACEEEILEPCWLVKGAPEENFQQWAGEIAGFTYEPGYEYELEVIETGSGGAREVGEEAGYELVRIVEQKPVASVWIDQPGSQTTVTGGKAVMVKGGGRNLYENNVVVEVLDESDQVLVSAATVLQVTEGTDEGDWGVELLLPATVSAQMKLVARSPVPVGENLLPISSLWVVGENTTAEY